MEKEEQLRRVNFKDSLHSEETADVEIRTLIILATDKLDKSQASLHDELKKKKILTCYNLTKNSVM